MEGSDCTAGFVGHQRGFASKTALGVIQPVGERIQKKMGLEVTDGNESGPGASERAGIGKGRSGRENIRDVGGVMVWVLLPTVLDG